jgi:hypothetical protein
LGVSTMSLQYAARIEEPSCHCDAHSKRTVDHRALL